jgi:hypothetical protein
MDEGKYTMGVFLDLSKAFDTVNFEILFKKLQHYGIRGICREWFKDYLHGRTQIVKFKHHRSIEMNVTTRVPQGSILGPLLFLLYINDIENCSDILSFVLYADDTNAFYSNSCLKRGAGVIFGLAYSLSISKCGGLKYKGLYWRGGGGGGVFNSEVYSVTKNQQRDSFMRRYDYGLLIN